MRFEETNTKLNTHHNIKRNHGFPKAQHLFIIIQGVVAISESVAFVKKVYVKGGWFSKYRIPSIHGSNLTRSVVAILHILRRFGLICNKLSYGMGVRDSPTRKEQAARVLDHWDR